MRKLLVAAVASLAVLLTGCSSAPLDRHAGAGQSLTIGSEDPFADHVVAQIYGQALAADGYAVDYNTGVRGHTAMLDALEAGRVDLTPVSVGDMLETVQPGASTSTLQRAVDALQIALTKREVTALTPSQASTTPVFVVRVAAAKAYGLETLADLSHLTAPWTIASVEDLTTTPYSPTALANAYNVGTFSTLNAASDDAVLGDLSAGTALVGVISTSAATAHSDELVQLGDPSALIPPQNIVPLVRTAVASQEVTRVVGTVSGLLTSADLAAFQARSDELPSTVASDWLAAHRLVTAR